MFLTDMLTRFFKFFVEKIYYTMVSYNRWRDKQPSDELWDIKCRQFFIVFALTMYFFGTIAFCLARFVCKRSLQEYMFVDVILAVIITVVVTRNLGKLGLYEEVAQKVEGMSKVEQKRLCIQSTIVGSLRVVSVVIFIYVGCWLLTLL